jgi:hypothetical protein|tara:strand:+ start:494 stop:598 length:105 start_codon:yes stop_codon:yes gene_type:complete
MLFLGDFKMGVSFLLVTPLRGIKIVVKLSVSSQG